MSKRISFICAFLAIGLLFVSSPGRAFGQAFGLELHNTVMPASGGMAGASIARPQDIQSAVNGNPATVASLRGTQFSFGGAWVEPTYKVRNMMPMNTIIPGVGTFNAKSNAQGAALGNIAVTQDLRPLGLPATMGLALVSSTGAGVSFRQIPASNGTSAMIQGLGIESTIGVDLTERLSAGARVTLGSLTLDGPFTGLTGAAYDYALRGSLGLNYDLTSDTTIGAYYQTKQNFNFDSAVRIALPGGQFARTTDIDLDLPSNVGIGIANESLFCGRLLLAMDVMFKSWDETSLLGALWTDQWVYQFGAQYKLNEQIRIRAGYAYAENITEANPGNTAGGVTPPGAQAAIRYVQAQFAAINEHRISGGVGFKNLLPNVDLDLFAGGMLEASQQYGPLTSASVESYWIGGGLTWHFGGLDPCETCDGCVECVE